MAKSYKIMGEYRRKTEEIDEVDTKKEADSLAREYRIAYGEDWRIWVEEDEEDDEDAVV